MNNDKIIKKHKKISKIFSMEDSTLKKLKLMNICLKAIPQGQIWRICNEEINRLWDLGY